MTRNIPHILLTLALIITLASCSTTRRIPADETLYTGVKEVKITDTDEGVKFPESVKEKLMEAVNVEPNNAFFHSSSVRWPVPMGLWVYNNWNDPGHGFKHWLYNKLVATPVLVSDVRPELRTHLMDQILDHNGYFQGTASYQLVSGRNKHKAKLLYVIDAGHQYTIDSLILLPDTTDLTHLINQTVERRVPYLRDLGQRYCIDSLSTARNIITNSLRNRGYYFFRPEYIEYLADSTLSPGNVALKLVLASNTPEFALKKYVTGDVKVNIFRNQGGGTPDTIQTPYAELVLMRPSRFRTKLIEENVVFRKGRTFSVAGMNLTQTRLSRLGIFNAIDINVRPDTVAEVPTLDVDVNATFDSPLTASVEVNVTSKSNSYLGPGATFGITNRNIFGGGEQFSVKLTGSYEWQTGKGKGRSIFNSYEAGITATLSFPRLLCPNFIPRSRRELNWTNISLNADILNRPHFFRLAQLNTSFGYSWRATRYVTNTLTLFKLTYTKLLNTTANFDSIMIANPAVALSFQSQFIPQMSFEYVYDRQINPDNNINWQFQITEGGNVFWAIYELCGKHGKKQLFGNPFSQFIKGQTQFVWGRRIMEGENWLYTRIAVGAEHAYGNSTQVPYAEQFYCGGANSVRAFTVRSIGPGSYHDPRLGASDYFDQTGTFKFEANIEYRFPLYGPLHGALFLDSGNVWLLKKDPMRPGGLLESKTFLKDLAVGTGFGLRFDISMLVLRGDLGIGIHAPYQTGKRGYYNMPSFKKSLAFHLAIGYPF